MTTLAYNHKDKEIAIDSRCTSGGLIVSDKFNKVRVKDGVKFIGTGAVADIALLVEGYPQGFATPITLEAQAFVVEDGKLMLASVIEGDYHLDLIEHDTTLGSGASFALAALDFGKSAKESVKYAMTRDTGTGGRIKVIKV